MICKITKKKLNHSCLLANAYSKWFFKKKYFKKEFFFKMEVGFSKEISLFQLNDHPKPN